MITFKQNIRADKQQKNLRNNQAINIVSYEHDKAIVLEEDPVISERVQMEKSKQ